MGVFFDDAMKDAIIELKGKIIENEKNKLKDNFEIIQIIDLAPYDKDHAMIIAKYIEKN